MTNEARIVLGVEGHDVAEEVMHFLERVGGARVVATAEDGAQLDAAVRQTEPHAIVASPTLASALSSVNGSVVLAVDTSESVQSLRRAIGAGAHGFFLWPSEREALASAIGRVRPALDHSSAKRARVIAVWGPRGGSGSTFVATHLAAAFARSERETALVDMNPLYGDVGTALGCKTKDDLRTIADVAPVADELSARHLEDILWRHPEGFGVLLPPADAVAAADLDIAHLERAVRVLSTSMDAVLLDVPRSAGPESVAAFGAADLALVVLSLDVLSFHDAKRALDAGVSRGVPHEFVVNRAGRAEIAASDVERVFGRPAVAVIPFDPRVGQSQDRGRLLPARSRTGRAMDRLVRELVEAES